MCSSVKSSTYDVFLKSRKSHVDQIISYIQYRLERVRRHLSTTKFASIILPAYNLTMKNKIIKKLIDKAQKAYTVDRWDRVCQAFDCVKPSTHSYSQTKGFFEHQKYPIGLIPVTRASIFKGLIL